MNDEWSKFYKDVYDQDTQIDGASGWIQWKGTDVCMDVSCACGHSGHVDADFFYRYECPACGQKYAVGQNVKLIALTPEQVAYDAKSGVDYATDNDKGGPVGPAMKES